MNISPAHAGVIPICISACTRTAPFPRTRGGDPPYVGATVNLYTFSPHARG